MPFDIIDTKLNKVVTSVVIPASASKTFAFTIKHHSGPGANQQPVSIEADVGTNLQWNDGRLDSTGQKTNTLGPSGSPNTCGDGSLLVKVGSGQHVETLTFPFRFEKQG